jgi:hypothetical protein
VVWAGVGNADTGAIERLLAVKSECTSIEILCNGESIGCTHCRKLSRNTGSDGREVMGIHW